MDHHVVIGSVKIASRCPYCRSNRSFKISEQNYASCCL